MISPFLAPLVILAQLAPAPALPPVADASARSAFVPPPAPPPPPQPGTPEFARERTAQERRLREQCYSEAGVKLLIEHWTRQRAMPPETWAADRAAEIEVAEAAFAQPVDIDRLERAIRARAALRAERDAQRESERFELLRALSAADRAIYAREVTAFRPSPQTIGVCPA